MDMRTVCTLDKLSPPAVASGGGVVGGSGTNAETTLEMRPVLLAMSTARIAKYLAKAKGHVIVSYNNNNNSYLIANVHSY